jgi:hypothetical protein
VKKKIKANNRASAKSNRIWQKANTKAAPLPDKSFSKPHIWQG